MISNHIHVPSRCHHASSPLDIKKSSYKKVSAFLNFLAEERVITLSSNLAERTEEANEGTPGEILYLTGFTKKHELFKGVKIDDPEIFKRRVESTSHGNDEGGDDKGVFSFIPSSNKPSDKGPDKSMQVVELFKLNKVFKEVVGNVLGGEYSGLATYGEIKHILMEYIAKQGLEDSLDRSQVKFTSDDPIIACLNMSMLSKPIPKEIPVTAKEENPPYEEEMELKPDYVGGVWIPSSSTASGGLGGWGSEKGAWKAVELPKSKLKPAPPPVNMREPTADTYQVKNEALVKAAVAKLGNYYAIHSNGILYVQHLSYKALYVISR